MKYLIILMMLVTGLTTSQTIQTIDNRTQVQTFNTIQSNQLLFMAQQRGLNGFQPLTRFANQYERTTIIIERSPFTQPLFQPALNVYQQTERGLNCTKNKIERPFVPVYIHLNLNNNR